jgi:hypothetical protein
VSTPFTADFHVNVGNSGFHNNLSTTMGVLLTADISNHGNISNGGVLVKAAALTIRRATITPHHPRRTRHRPAGYA